MGLILLSRYIPCFKSSNVLYSTVCVCLLATLPVADPDDHVPDLQKLLSSWSNFCKHSPAYGLEKISSLIQERICTVGGAVCVSMCQVSDKEEVKVLQVFSRVL